MSAISRIKDWFKKTFGGSSSSSSRSARTVSNYGGGGSRSYSSTSRYLPKEPIESKQQRMAREAKERKAKQDATTKALASTIDKKAKDVESSLNTATAKATSGVDRVIQKMGERAKSAPPDPKIAQAQKSREDATKALRSLEKVARKATTKPERRMTGTVEGAKIEAERNPIATMAARKAVNGALFGVPDLVGKVSAKGDMRELENAYQKTAEEHPWIAGGSEIAGSLVGFGLTGAASKQLAGGAAKKVVNKKLGEGAAEELFEKQVAKLAGNEAIKKAARREALMAAKQGAIRAVDEEVVKKFALDRARRILNGVAEDMAINATTGLAYDLTSSATDSDNLGEFAKNMALNAGLNAIVGGIQPIGGALIRTKRGALDAAGRIFADEAGDAIARNADEVIERAAVNAVEDNADNVARNVEPPRAVEEVTPPPMQEEVAPPPLQEEAPAPAPAQTMTPEAAVQVAGKDEELFDMYSSRFEQSLNTADIDRMEETLERMRRTYEESGVPFDATEWETAIERYKRVASDIENGVEWRIGNRGWERKSIKGKSKGKWIKNDPLKTAPPKKPKVEAPTPKGVEADEYARLMDEGGEKADNIRAAIADKRKPKRPPTSPDERADNIRNFVSAENEADDVSRYASIDQDVDFKGEPVNKGFTAEGDQVADVKAQANEEIRRGVETADLGNNAFDKERAEAYRSVGAENINPENTRHATVEDINKARGQETRDYTTHTERGFNTIATGIGDKAYQGAALDAISRGELNIDVYHNAENYGKAAKRINEHVAKYGDTNSLADKFEQYASGKLKMDVNEQRDLIYDVLAAVDFANANVNNKEKYKEMERLFLAACKAGSEQVSVGGLTGNQWRKIAMSSPEYRAKAVHQAILDLFNRSKGFRQAVGKGKKGDKITMDELDDLLKKNPQLKKTLAALENLKTAASVEEVEKLADKAVLEARKVVPLTAFDQLTQWRYVAMLSSPKTHIRNLTSNIYSSTLGQLRDGIASVTEDNIIKGTGKYGKQFKAAVEKGKIDESEYMKSVGGMSVAARRNSRKGLSSGLKVDKLSHKLDVARDQLAEAKAGSAEFKKLTSRVKDLESQLEKETKAMDDAVAKLNPTAKKAQETWRSSAKDNLVTNAEKFEHKHYEGKASKLAFKANDKMSSFISNALETSDAVTLEQIYRERYEKILNANGWDKLLADGSAKAKARMAQIEAYAEQEASYIAALDTYRNYTKLSSAMSKFVSDSLFNYDAPLWKKFAGLMVHGAMPFTKVPVNLVKRGIDYSPVGLMTAKKALSEAIESGDVVAINRACERLAEGSIGTGIAALGAGLGFLDPESMLITGRLSKNDYLDKKKKDAGYQNYAINGKNLSFTLDWATPTAATLFTGVEFGRMLRHLCDDIANGNGLDFKFWDAFEVPLTLASTLLEPTLQLGVFQGVNQTLENVVESDNYSDTNVSPAINIVKEVFTNYATSVMTPAVMSSLSRAFAPYDYFITGANDSEYAFNMEISKFPFLSNQMLGAKTNVWGQIKNEKSNPADYALSAAKNLLSPANINKITWDETDQWAADYYKETGWEGAFPKNNYKKDISIGRIKGAHDLTLNNKELAEYNVARGKSGGDAMADVLETVIFNRYDKDEKGHRTIPHSSNKSAEEKANLIKQYEGKGIKEVLNWLINEPSFKNATLKEQQQAIQKIYGDSGDSDDESVGAKRYAERTVAVKKGMSADEYDYYNEVPRNAQEALAPAIASGLITFKQAVDFSRDAGKTYYTTDERGEKGGTVTTHYNKKEMLAYLESVGYSEEEAAALYNAFKTSTAKEYGASSSRSGYRRRGGYRRYGHRGGSSKKAKVPTPKTIKASQLVKGEALVSKKSSSSAKATAPTLKRVEAKIDLPKVKR